MFSLLGCVAVLFASCHCEGDLTQVKVLEKVLDRTLEMNKLEHGLVSFPNSHQLETKYSNSRYAKGVGDTSFKPPRKLRLDPGWIPNIGDFRGGWFNISVFWYILPWLHAHYGTRCRICTWSQVRPCLSNLSERWRIGIDRPQNARICTSVTLSILPSHLLTFHLASLRFNSLREQEHGEISSPSQKGRATPGPC